MAAKPYFLLQPPLNLLLGSHARCAAIAVTLAAACYWNSLQGGLVHDDIFAIRDNPDVRPETPLAQVFTNDFWGRPMSSNVSHKSYRPLTVLSFRANYALHGLEPLGYHAVNVALHALATGLLGWLCRRLVFRQPDLAFLVMCLFASHPVHTEAVSGVVGRAELLSCVCFLLSLTLYTSALGHDLKIQALAVCGCVVLGGVAMLFKESGATVLGVCLAYDILIHSHQLLWKTVIKRSSPMFPSLSPFLLRSALLLGATLTLLALRLSLLHGQLPRFSDHDNPASFAPHTLTRALTYCHLFSFNAQLLVFPLTLCYDWQMGSIPLVEGLTDARNGWTLLFFVYLGLLTVTALYRTHSVLHPARSRVVLFSLLLVVVPFLPASNLLLRVGFVVAERILYIPSIGYCILIVQGIKSLTFRLNPSHPHPSHPHSITNSNSSTTPPHSLTRLQSSHPHSPTKSPPPPPSHPHSPVLFYVCLMLVALFSLRTMARNPVWHTRESLFKSGLATVPHNAKIHYNYANYLRDTGRPEEAAHHYKQALQLAPDHVSSHNNLGSLPVVGSEEAEFHFREAVRYSPTHYRAFYNLGNNLLYQGKLKESEEALRECLKINSDYHGALMTLATILTDTGRAEEGLHYMQRAASVVPHDALVRNNMAVLFIQQGMIQEGIREYHFTLSLQPGQAKVMGNLARAYRLLGDNDNAELWFLESLSIEEDASTYNSLAALYFNTGRHQKAKRSFSRALALDPRHLEAQCSYLQCFIKLGELEEAERQALLAIDRHRPSTPACLHLTLAIVYAQKSKKLQEALKHSSLATKATDTHSRAEAHHVHAGILKDMGQLEDAEKSYQQAIALSPTMLNAHMNLGALLHIRKNYSEARKYYERALSLDPGNRLVTENLEKLNRLEKAR